MPSKSTLVSISLVATLCLITLVTITVYPKYIINGEEMLINNSFSGQFAGWEKQGEPDNFKLGENFVELSQDAIWQSTRLVQRVKPIIDVDSYLLSGELATDGLVAGKESWQRGGLILLRFNEQGDRVASDDVVSLDGDLSWSKHREFIDVPQQTFEIAVVARILNTTGKLRIKSLSLHPAEKQPLFETIRIGFIATWTLFVITLIISVIRHFGFTTPLIVVSVLAGLAVVGTLMPRDAVIGLDARIMNLIPDHLAGTIKDIFNTLLPGYIKHENQEISKLGHWLVFLLLGLSSALYFRRSSLWICGLALLTMAATTETLQLLTDARSAHVNDLLIDGAGIATGFLLAVPIRLIRHRI